MGFPRVSVKPKMKKKLRRLKSPNKKITDYWSPRKSMRLIAKKQKASDELNLHEKILNGIEEGLTVKTFPDKGRGVVATRKFYKDEYVLHYVGDSIDPQIAHERELQYVDEEKDCYIFSFEFGGKKYCIDATEENGRLGRLINHSRLRPNCETRLMVVHGKPYITIWTRKDISVGDELLFDYGVKSRAATEAYPWLANS